MIMKIEKPSLAYQVALEKRIKDLENLVRFLMLMSVPPKYSKTARDMCEQVGIGAEGQEVNDD